MSQINSKFQKWLSTEAAFTLYLWVLYFMVIAFGKDHFYIPFHEFVFALTYFLAITFINYWLMPHFLYRKRYILFVLLSLLVIAVVIALEELVLEQLFFPKSRMASRFPGILFCLAEVGPIILFFVGFKLAWDNLKSQSQLEQFEKEKLESELQFLKSQLNPHFLFNNLNNLYSYVQEHSPKAPEIVLQLSAIMRYILYESRENFVPLEKDLRYLEDFIRLQELQMESRGEVIFSVDGPTQSKVIAPLILIAFVENCFKHSLSSQSEDIFIRISAKIEGDRLHFQCSNTFSETVNQAEKHIDKGIGLENVQKRLTLLYPGKHALKTQANAGVYYVDLDLDLAST